MANFLIARVVDVTEQPVKAARPSASFGGGPPVPLAPVASAPGVFEARVPDGVRDARLTIPDLPDLWGVEQGVAVGTGDPPTIAAAGGTSINVRAFTVHTRGADHNVEVHVVMGQVRDAAAKCHAVADPVGITLAPKAEKLRRFGTPMLRSGAKTDPFDQRHETVTPGGKLFLLERPIAPKLIAVHLPDLPRPTSEPEKSPIPFHVFFHPTIFTPPRGSYSLTYPYHQSYMSLISRYCVVPWDPADQTAGCKSMIHQSHAGGAKAAFVFPVGSPREQMGSLRSPSGLLRLLDDISYWLQRTLGEAYPRQPVGKLAVSGFSAGITFLNAAVFGGTNARLDDLLRHIFSLDGVFSSPVKGEGEKMTLAFCNKVKAWHRKGADGRTFRAYTQNGLWWAQFAGYEKPTIVKAGEKEEAMVADTASTTVLHVVPRFELWRPLEPWLDAWMKMQNPVYWFGHALFPSWFLEHAMTRATF